MFALNCTERARDALSPHLSAICSEFDSECKAIFGFEINVIKDARSGAGAAAVGFKAATINTC